MKTKASALALALLVLIVGTAAGAAPDTDTGAPNALRAGQDAAPTHRAMDVIRGTFGSDASKQPIGMLYHTPIINWEYDQIHPRVAFSPPGQAYLVVWEDHHWGFGQDWDIYGRLVAPDGTPLGMPFGISWDGATRRIAPSVACNQITGEFLVVWEYAYGSADHDVYGRRVAANGSLIGEEFAINADGAFEAAPAVTYNPDCNEFLVVYEWSVGDPEFQVKDVWSNVITATGVVRAPQAVAGTADDERAPDVACSPPSDRYLVVYEKHPPHMTDGDIWGQFVADDGTALGAALLVGDQPERDKTPRVTHDPFENEFSVVWVGGPPSDRNLGLRHVDAATGAMNHSSSIVTPNADFNPAIAYYPGGAVHVVPWEWEYSSTDHDVYCFWDEDDYFGAEFTRSISMLATWEGSPAVASDGNLSGLVVWEDWRSASTTQIDIWGDVLKLGVLSGRVFEGPIPAESSPLPGVEVILYGSQNPGALEHLLDRAWTDRAGHYRLRFTGLYDYYTVVETDPPEHGYGAASSPEGVVLDANHIQFTTPALGANHPDNKFWDLYGVGVDPGGPGEGPLRVSAPSPNPTRGSVSLTVQGGASGSLVLEVLDVAGRVVSRSIVKRPAGERLVWDGRFNDGRVAPSGVYLLRIGDGVTEVVQRAVVLR